MLALSHSINFEIYFPVYVKLAKLIVKNHYEITQYIFE